MMRSKHLGSGLTTHGRVPGVATTLDNFVLHVCNTMGSGCRVAALLDCVCEFDGLHELLKGAAGAANIN